MCRRAKKLSLLLLITAFLGGNVYMAPKVYDIWELHQRTERQIEIVTKVLYPTAEININGLTSRGSGVVIYSEPRGDVYDTYVLTCAHLFGHGGPIDLEWIKNIQVRLFNRDEEQEIVNAALIASDVKLDLAILKLESGKQFWPTKFASTELYSTIFMFEDVYHVGRIYGQILAPVASKIIYPPNEEAGATQGPIFPGYSGGPCYLAKDLGLIGINQQIAGVMVSPIRQEVVNTYTKFISILVVTKWLNESGYNFLLTKIIDDAAQDRIQLNNKQVEMAPKQKAKEIPTVIKIIEIPPEDMEPEDQE